MIIDTRWTGFRTCNWRNVRTDINNLKNEIAVLTVNPDAVLNFYPEDERTAYIDGLKAQLSELGVNADQFQKEVVKENFKLKAPLSNVIEIDFTQKVS